jgi:hypothetical protein
MNYLNIETETNFHFSNNLNSNMFRHWEIRFWGCPIPGLSFVFFRLQTLIARAVCFILVKPIGLNTGKEGGYATDSVARGWRSLTFKR